MKNDDLTEIVSHFGDLNDRLLVSVAFHIAAEMSFNKDMIEKYGTNACNQLQELAHDMKGAGEVDFGFKDDALYYNGELMGEIKDNLWVASPLLLEKNSEFQDEAIAFVLPYLRRRLS